MRGQWLSLAAIAMLWVCLPALAGVRQVKLDSTYLASGEKAAGQVICDSLPAQSRLRITLSRDVEIPIAATQPSRSTQVILDKPAAELGAAASIPFGIDTAGILTGSLRIKAESIAPDGSVQSSATSEPITVGIRKRLSLAGQWQVTKVEPYEHENKWRPKNWVVPQLAAVQFPGALTDDQWLRGWITVRRDISWKARGDLRARFLRLSQVHDSVQVRIGDDLLNETRPIEEFGVLSHWPEFHSPYKGEANQKTRMLFMDLLPQRPISQALPHPLPAEGSTTVEMRIRGTSGQFSKKPAYGVHGDLHLDLTPPVFVKSIGFDTEKPGEMRRLKFSLTIGNDSGQPFTGKLRAVYGRYEGKIAYTGFCPAYAFADQDIALKPGENTVEVVRDERPRFDSCRATFLIVKDDRVLDGDSFDYHTVTMEIRDRRDFYLNNERFFVKGQGSIGDAPHKRWQLRLMGGNAFRGPTNPDLINVYQSEGLLTSAGGALLASCEKCTFWDPRDTSNITRAVRGFTSTLSHCPGIIMWEATNELHGEPEEARVAILEAFHKLDPYHRPVVATKGSGEWEAEAHDGRVAGVDIVGCQYLLSKEGVDSITAAVTEQPIMSTEVNWNDMSFQRDGLWDYWLKKGVAGSLLFDYSGGALDQPAPSVPPSDNDQTGGAMIKRFNREMYQDLVASAAQQADGSVKLRLGNTMPYELRDVIVSIRNLGQIAKVDLKPGDAIAIDLPKEHSPPPREPVVVRAEYTTHAGLPHVAVLSPMVTALPKGGGK